MSESRKTNNFLVHGAILAGASILVRVIGLLYRIPMANILGPEGNGIYTIAFNIYNIILILSSYSLPLAVSKLIAARNVSHEHKNVVKIFRFSLLLGMCSGLIAAVLLYVGADVISEFYDMPEVARPLRVLAPTVFVVAVLGVFRGLYQGKSTMLPTAFSQILEQIINAAVSIYAAYTFMQAHSLSIEISSYGAAGGTFGTFMGAVTALLFLLFIYILYRPILFRKAKRDRTGTKLSSQEVSHLLLITVLPIIISQTVYQISGTLDDAIFSNMMKYKKVDPEIKKAFIGVYSSQYKILLSLPISISSAISTSLVPSIVSSVAIKQYAVVRKKIKVSMKFNMVVAFPSMVGLMVLAGPIMSVLFPQLSAYHSLAVNLMLCGSFAIIFYAISTITSGVLQGIDCMGLPVKHSLLSLAIHIPLVLGMLYANAGVYALIAGNITFPLVVAILNAKEVSRRLYYRQERYRTFVLPLVSSCLMGAVAFIMNKTLVIITNQEVIGLVGAIIVAVIFYFTIVFKLRIFAVSEYRELPFGNFFYRIAKKMGAVSK